MNGGVTPAKILPVKVARMPTSSDQLGVPMYGDVVHIPTVTNRMSCAVSAKPMCRWFPIKPAWAMPEAWHRGDYSESNPINYRNLLTGRLKDQLVKTQWAMRFAPERQAVVALQARWSTPMAVKVLKEKWITASWKPLGSVSNGRLPPHHLSTTLQSGRYQYTTFPCVDDFLRAHMLPAKEYSLGIQRRLAGRTFGPSVRLT